MCKYCASISSEFEYVNLSDSLSSIGENDNRSPNSDIDRVDPVYIRVRGSIIAFTNRRKGVW